MEIPLPDNLDDGVVRVRPWAPADALALVAWEIDDALVRDGRAPLPGEQAALAEIRRHEAERQAGHYLSLAIVPATTEVPVGACYLSFPVRSDRFLAELGYQLCPSARRHGFATRAGVLLLKWAFEDLLIRRMQALVRPRNTASIAVLERLGFRREGLLRSYRWTDDGRADCVMFGLLSTDRRPALAPPERMITEWCRIAGLVRGRCPSWW